MKRGAPQIGIDDMTDFLQLIAMASENADDAQLERIARIKARGYMSPDEERWLRALAGE